MPRPDQRQFLMRVLKGETASVVFCELLFGVSQIWDDLIDRDRPVAPAEIHRAFWNCLVDIPYNRFYREYQNYLQPLLVEYATAYMDSVALERGSDHERNMAWGLRDAVGAIVNHCAYLVGGHEWLREVSVEIRRHIYEETLEDYRKGLEKEVEA